MSWEHGCHEGGGGAGDLSSSVGVCGGVGGVYYHSSLSVREWQMQFACKYLTPLCLPPSRSLCHVEQLERPSSLALPQKTRGEIPEGPDGLDSLVVTLLPLHQHLPLTSTFTVHTETPRPLFGFLLTEKL